jgi:hypothetical protein
MTRSYSTKVNRVLIKFLDKTGDKYLINIASMYRACVAPSDEEFVVEVEVDQATACIPIETEQKALYVLDEIYRCFGKVSRLIISYDGNVEADI